MPLRHSNLATSVCKDIRLNVMTITELHAVGKARNLRQARKGTTFRLTRSLPGIPTVMSQHDRIYEWACWLSKLNWTAPTEGSLPVHYVIDHAPLRQMIISIQTFFFFSIVCFFHWLTYSCNACAALWVNINTKYTNTAGTQIDLRNVLLARNWTPRLLATLKFKLHTSTPSY